MHGFFENQFSFWFHCLYPIACALYSSVTLVQYTLVCQDCVLDEWLAWGVCSTSCDMGQSYRSRKIITAAVGTLQEFHERGEQEYEQ